jgi:uncharacterized protein YjgD (DUF1641 family)
MNITLESLHDNIITEGAMRGHDQVHPELQRQMMNLLQDFEKSLDNAIREFGALKNEPRLRKRLEAAKNGIKISNNKAYDAFINLSNEMVAAERYAPTKQAQQVMSNLRQMIKGQNRKFMAPDQHY